MASDNVVNDSKLLVETGGAQDDYVCTRLAVILALVFLVVVLVEREDYVPGSDEVDVLVFAAGAEIEAACPLGTGPILSEDRDVEGRGERRVGREDGIEEPIARLSHSKDSLISTW